VKEVIIEYTGEANDRLLSSIVERLSSEKLALSTDMRRRLVNVTIEVVNNIISHSANKKVISFLITKQNNEVEMIATNLSSENNFESARLRLKNLTECEDLKELTDKSISDSASKGSAHLGIIKIYKNTRGNLQITKTEMDRSLIFKSNCVLHEEN
jgi:hypothetical protein